ncbi:glycosyltransferase family 4 protein [Salinimicrobium gaetbulicola]|uniref:Glycosyltransferase family 4 protein n=1 Tax=Salinimicrobium gaetbulicola TaxID=999702 RepID=A0ABW3IFG1_9FLAO
MKKVLLINDHIHFSGGGDAALKFEQQLLIESGFDVYTLSFGKEESYYGKDFVIQIPTNRVEEKVDKFLMGYKIKKEVTSIINKIAPDLIHIHLISKFPVAVYNSTALENVPVIQTLHGPTLFCSTGWGGLKNSGPCELGIDTKCSKRGCMDIASNLLYINMKNRYWEALKKNVDAFHCPSLNILNSAKRLGLPNSTYIPLGIDQQFLEEPIKVKNERPTLVFLGAIADVKGVQFLLPALKKIKEEIPNVLLKIGGKGKLLVKLKEQAELLDLTNNVDFAGFISRNKVREFYLTSDVFLMPSIWQEQFGLVGPEAMACKLPCIGSNVGGIPEWLKHNQTGFLTPPQDIQSLVKYSILLLKDPALREKMGDTGRKLALKEYGSDLYKENLLNLISQFIN